jgi:hypothetical protein
MHACKGDPAAARKRICTAPLRSTLLELFLFNRVGRRWHVTYWSDRSIASVCANLLCRDVGVVFFPYKSSHRVGIPRPRLSLWIMGKCRSAARLFWGTHTQPGAPILRLTCQLSHQRVPRIVIWALGPLYCFDCSVTLPLLNGSCYAPLLAGASCSPPA